MIINKVELEEGEAVLLTVRKHWFVITMRLLSVGILALLPLFAYIALSFMPFVTSIIDKIEAPILVALYAGWLIICWMMLFSIWTDYYLDVWTITTKRLVTVDQRGLFNRLTGSFRLERLQDIEVYVRGIIATFLDYGDLEAETASEDQHFVARNIPHPQDVKALILKQADVTTFPGKNPETAPHNDISMNGGV